MNLRFGSYSKFGTTNFAAIPTRPPCKAAMHKVINWPLETN